MSCDCSTILEVVPTKFFFQKLLALKGLINDLYKWPEKFHCLLINRALSFQSYFDIFMTTFSQLS